MTHGGDEPGAFRKTHAVALAVVLLAAAGLRYWGLAFGLPHTQARPDESRIVNLAVQVAGGDLNPHYFVYPTLYIYLLAAAVKTLAIVRGVALAALPYEDLLLTGRALTAAFGSATVAIVYAIGRRAGGRITGLTAAALLAFAFLHVRDSHFSTIDVPMTSLVAADVLILLASGRRVRDAAPGGLVAGLATAMKYNAALLGAVALVLEAHAALTGAQTWRQSLQRLALFVVCMTGGFLAGAPYSIVDREAFRSGISFVDSYLQSGHVHDGRVLAVPNAAAYYLTFVLPAGVGWGLFLAGIAGLLVCLRSNVRVGLTLAVFPCVYFLTAARGQTVFARYMIPVVPFLCLGAAYFIRAAAAAMKTSRLVPQAAAIGLAVAIAAPTAMKSVRLDALLAKPDNRLIAGAWIHERLKGTSVCETGSLYGRVHPETGGSSCSGTDGLNDYIVVQRSPLDLYSAVPAPMEALVRSRYVLIQSFPTGLDALRQQDYDASDAFFIPLNGLEALRRPGPEFDVYELRRE